jgi:hypothetical protein
MNANNRPKKKKVNKTEELVEREISKALKKGSHKNTTHF